MTSKARSFQLLLQQEVHEKEPSEELAEGLADKKSIREGYDTYVSRFFDLMTLFFLGPSIMNSHRALLKLLHPQRQSTILDVGCGTGTLLRTIALERHGDYLVGLDLSRGMLTNAKMKMAGAGVQNRVDLVLADAEMLPFRRSSFCEVTCTGVLRFLPNPTAAFRENHRVLRVGGRFAMREMAGLATAIRVRHPPVPFKKGFVVWRLWPKRLIERMFDGAGFADVEIFGKPTIPHFVYALTPPFRQYVFAVAAKTGPIDASE